MSESIERFTQTVQDYIKYRPSYPQEVIQLLVDECNLKQHQIIADVGSGTGFLSKLLLDFGAIVYGVEPNDAMRVAAEDYLKNYTMFRSINGTAEADFFKLNYVAAKSGHTRGSTADLTIIDIKTNKELDMGTHFDFMDELSHPFNRSVMKEQYKNRQLLNQVMAKNGFIPLNEKDTEWWHFTLKEEPFPDNYFNFSVKALFKMSEDKK